MEAQSDLVTANGDGSHESELAELVQSLDEWLSKGGFLPEDWRV